MNYAEMSDFEINKAVFFLSEIDYEDYYHHPHPENCASFIYYARDNWNEFDPCNNPSDAWPIILENKINIYASEGPDFTPWMAGCNHFMVSHKNPLRAAMIVFLMMNKDK